MKTGAGSIGAAGLAAVGLVGAPVSRVNAAAKTAGLRPLYAKTLSKQSSALLTAASVSTIPTATVRALRRLGFGFRTDDLVAFEALGGNFDQRLEAYVNDQLDNFDPAYPPVNDPPLSAILNQPGTNFDTLTDSLQTLWQERVVAEPGWPDYLYPLVDTQFLSLLRAVYSKWQLAEVLADFWHTHFNVDGTKFEVSPVFVHYDRDVIRPNMLGNFRQMLEAVTTSTAMLGYLDNASNSKYGPNENFARELQELHTQGAVNSFGFTTEQDIPEAIALPGSSAILPTGLKGGYSEQDVRQVTLALTGLTISNRWTDGLNTGEFLYLSDWHDDSSKRVYGIDLSSSGLAESGQIFDLLAVHPNTARYVCEKLCRRLISDNPPASIIEKAAIVFNDQWQAADQLKQVVKTIILSDEFKDAGNWGAKTKKPFELMAGTVRSCGGFSSKIVRPDMSAWRSNLLLGKNFAYSQDVYGQLGNTGNMLFTWTTPDGFPDSKPAWLGSTPLVMVWRMINGSFMSWFPDDLTDLDNSAWSVYFPIDAVTKTKNALPAGQRTAATMVDYWVNQLLGYDSSNATSPQLNSQMRSRLIAFMQQNAPGADTLLDLDASGWDNLAWKAYVPHRLQTLVASIAMLPDNLLR